MSKKPPKDFRPEKVSIFPFGDLTFTTHNYDGGGRDGRFSFAFKQQVLGLNMRGTYEQSVIVHGFGAKELRQLAQWATKAAEWVESEP